MVERIVVAQEQIPQLVQEWLAVSGVSGELEVYFLPNELLIRPRAPENKELKAWLKSAMQRYDNLLHRLAAS
jgi:hypothetical protein